MRTSHALARHVRAGSSVFVCLAATGCYPGTFDSTEETDLVGTFFDEGRDYSDAMTYAMPDEVYDLEDLDIDGVLEHDTQFDQLALDLVADNMADLGYERLDDPEDPDADRVMLVGVVVKNNWYIYYPGWGYYPPYWGGGWGYWYPYPVPVNYPSGSIIIAMISPDERDEEQQLVPVVWMAGLHGYVTSSETPESTRRRITYGINQAFSQSSYLRVGDPVDPGDGADGGAQ